ncbi:hypothetical protein K491DRAFT_761619 [Lophiostoma macrostomum CBS 122681]|uniref:Uncharacterized protein n=1 Tax=Lophiostoma macrostomum CBS 122681 TaxID=1314788 RepID=A0A6A6SUH0_9PLEO|nr:hypothetical protein K491DRAFT_761619 [Lophiostoma macrostomum CBS 122681]
MFSQCKLTISELLTDFNAPGSEARLLRFIRQAARQVAQAYDRNGRCAFEALAIIPSYYRIPGAPPTKNMLAGLDGVYTLGIRGVDVRFVGYVYEDVIENKLSMLNPDLIDKMMEGHRNAYTIYSYGWDRVVIPPDEKITRQMWVDEWLE